jgi:hypothetical protein
MMKKKWYTAIMVMIVCTLGACGSRAEVSEEPGEEPPAVTEEPEKETPAVTEEPEKETPAVTEEPEKETPAVTEEPEEEDARYDSVGNEYGVVLEPDGVIVETDYFIVELPESWEGKFLYSVEKEERWLSLYHRASYREDAWGTPMGGWLGSIFFCTIEYAEALHEISSAAAFGEPVAMEDGTYTYVADKPTDVQWDLNAPQEEIDEYLEMSNLFEYEDGGMICRITRYVTIK